MRSQWPRKTVIRFPRLHLGSVNVQVSERISPGLLFTEPFCSPAPDGTMLMPLHRQKPYSENQTGFGSLLETTTVYRKGSKYYGGETQPTWPPCPKHHYTGFPEDPKQFIFFRLRKIILP